MSHKELDDVAQCNCRNEPSDDQLDGTKPLFFRQ